MANGEACRFKECSNPGKGELAINDPENIEAYAGLLKEHLKYWRNMQGEVPRDGDPIQRIAGEVARGLSFPTTYLGIFASNRERYEKRDLGCVERYCRSALGALGVSQLLRLLFELEPADRHNEDQANLRPGAAWIGAIAVDMLPRQGQKEETIMVGEYGVHVPSPLANGWFGALSGRRQRRWYGDEEGLLRVWRCSPAWPTDTLRRLYASNTGIDFSEMETLFPYCTALNEAG